MVLLLAGLWLGLAGSRCSLALTVASRAGALKRLHAGALKLKASSKENADDVERTTAEAEWLQKTAAEIKQFGVDEVSSWVRAALEEDNYAEEALEITGILESQKVKGTALPELTADKMRAVGILMGPAEVLAKRIAAVSAPPTAASAFQDDLSATEFIQELANAEPTDLGEGVQVFNLTKSLPVEPYDQSGPRLLTRNTTRRAWKATFELMRNGTKRVAMLGVPGIGKSRNLALGLWHLVTDQVPDRILQPEAIVFEARQSKTVFLFTKDQDGEWKAESLAMEDWKPSACPYLKNTSNWYLVDAFQADNPIMLAAKTVIACSPDRNHYSDFLKSAGECVFVEAFRWVEVEVCHPWLETQVDKEVMRHRFQQVGGALRTLLASQTGYKQAVELQRAEAKEFSTVERAFAGELNNVEGKTMPTRLFTHGSVDGISHNVSVCSPGAATLLVEKHYDKLVQLWCDPSTPRSRYWLEDFVGVLLTKLWSGKTGLFAFEVTKAANAAAKRAQWNYKSVMDLPVKEGLQLLECDTDHIFDARWREAVQRGSLEGRVLHSPENYPGIDYLLEFNHGISVTTSLKHDIAKSFREKLVEMFGNASQPCSFTLTFLITGEPQKFTPKGSDYEALKDMAGSEKFDNVRVQIVQIPKTLNSLS